MMRSFHAASFLLLAVTACALTRNTPAREVHYFSPELSPPLATVPAPVGAAAPVPLRLGHVDHIDVLGHRIVHRTSAVELALYETRRWTERPDEYVRRALLDALFETRPFARALTGAAPTLDVELLAFEEVLAPRHVGRVRLRYVLHDRRIVLSSGDLVAEVPVAGDDFAAVVQAIAAANRAAAVDLADRVQGRLCPTASPQ
jgi:cholesterol transport system auxiliary component